MTQHGSFPDRPRGRRARHGSDTPDWQGRDVVPSDEREFPDLAPIRDRRLSEADNRSLPGDRGGRGRHSAPAGPGGAPAWPDEQQQFGGQQAPYDRQPQHGQEAQYGQQDRREYGGGQYSPEQLGKEQLGAGQYGLYATPEDRPLGQARPSWSPPAPAAPEEPSQPATARHGRSRGGQPGQAAPSWAQDDSEVTDDPMEAFSRRWARRGAEAPGDARNRQRLWIIGGSAVSAIIVAVAVVLYFTVFSGGSNGNVSFGSLVTTFLPGEIQKVPDACKVVSASTLSQYLPGGQPEIAAPPLNGGLDSQCTWTLDHAPTYRVIEVDVSASTPSGLASGDGSATFAAIDAYAADQQAMEKPAANSGQPAATVQEIPGLGTQAFSATQMFDVGGASTYKATVIVRYRNVIVRAFVNGLEKAVTKEGTYGPVSMSTLTAAAQQVATQAVAQLTH